MTKVLSEIQRRTFSQRLVALEYLHPGYADKYERLERRLCADGTAIIVPPWPMRYLGLALSPRGGYYSGVIHPVPGQASACHQNIAALYQAGEIRSIATGFGLSGDGLWREHSWGIDSEHRIIETTTVRDDYFGATLLPLEVETFLKVV